MRTERNRGKGSHELIRQQHTAVVLFLMTSYDLSAHVFTAHTCRQYSGNIHLNLTLFYLVIRISKYI